MHALIALAPENGRVFEELVHLLGCDSLANEPKLCPLGCDDCLGALCTASWCSMKIVWAAS